MKTTTCDHCKNVVGAFGFVVTRNSQQQNLGSLPSQGVYDFCSMRCLEAWAYEQQRPN